MKTAEELREQWNGPCLDAVEAVRITEDAISAYLKLTSDMSYNVPKKNLDEVLALRNLLEDMT